ncbi:peptide deformylase [Patescibacteria group bacterium]|nr:peptide deformylase [Patescibacteria group bacterium]
MALLKIRKYNDPILRTKCQEVKEITNEVRDLAKKMLKIMYQEQGIGLAAPQIGDKRRIIVVDARRPWPEAKATSERVGRGPLSLVNPKVVKKSNKQVSDFEGCLSLPGISLSIKRPKSVEIGAYLLEKEQNVRIKAEGLLARGLQHEIDHLDGILILDRVGFLKKIRAIKKLNPVRKPASKTQ